MVDRENSTSNEIQNAFKISRLQYFSWKQFNGKLTIESNSKLKWSLFFFQGKLLWGSGGTHPLRRWHRALTLHAPESVPRFMALRDNFEGWEYRALTSLLKQQEISQQQAVSAIADSLGEVLFDIIQQLSVKQLSYSYNQKAPTEPSIPPLDTEFVLKHTLTVWEGWRTGGLAKVSPNLAPFLQQPERLEQQTSGSVYQNFVTLLDGDRTLRDLSLELKQELLLVTRSLIPFIRQGIIKLTDIPDLSLPANPVAVETPSIPTAPPSRADSSPLIACVDDSIQTCQMLEKIITQAGYRFVSIQNPVEALATLIEHKPDLIFIDLMMPIVNGYEICSQLRRVSLFSHTPMVILTGSDGLIDRVRAKVVGASEFLSKPVEPEKIVSVVRKYVYHPSPKPSEPQIQFKPEF